MSQPAPSAQCKSSVLTLNLSDSSLSTRYSVLSTGYFPLSTFHIQLHTLTVPRKKKPKPFRAVTAVKSMSRAHIGAVPPTRREDADKKKRAQTKPKHKPTPAQWLDEQ